MEVTWKSASNLVLFGHVRFDLEAEIPLFTTEIWNASAQKLGLLAPDG